MFLNKCRKLNKYVKIARMSAQSLTNGGISYLFLNYILKIVYLLPILLLWRTLMRQGVETGMSLSQMLAYTYLGAVFSDILVVRSPASNWLYEGLFISLYQRPAGVLPHLVSQTMGGWIPQFLLFSLPMLVLAPLFGVPLNMASPWFLPSLLLCVSLGFAVDFLFACLTIYMKNASWIVYVIRMAVVSLLSGSVIPFSALPAGLGNVFQYQPFGSLAAAPLSIFTGLTDPVPALMLQILWNLLLWPAVFFAFEKTQERMVSYGG